MNIRYLVYPVLILVCTGLFACRNTEKNKKRSIDAETLALTTDTVIKGGFNAASGIPIDSNRIEAFLQQKPEFAPFASDFRNFYQQVDHQYVWYDQNGLIEFVGVLQSRIQNTAGDGLSLKIPYQPLLDSLLQLNMQEGKVRAPSVELELLLTAQYFYYAQHLLQGAKISQAESLQWYLPRKKLSYPDLLSALLSEKNIAAVEAAAVIQQYSALKEGLVAYRKIEEQGADVEVPDYKKSLRPGDSAASVAMIKQRLVQLGDAVAYDSSSVYTQDWIDAVNRFKQRHGLHPDSVLSKDMVQQLQVPVADRIRQIMVNLERQRWIPVDANTDELILVNIPEYRLHYFQGGKHLWHCNVVVGAVMNKTVVFSGDMQYVVFSPYWNVPQSIINKEIKPGMARNKNYLARHNMEWNGGRVRQKPGPKNSLGLVKFLFPNSNNIYLHDTPSKSLFNRQDRAFSHGCIRVSEPRELAIRVLAQDSTWTPEKIDAAMHAGKEKYVTLKKKIPVFIGYFTAFIGVDGLLNFRKDIYNKDKALLDLLMEQ